MQRHRGETASEDSSSDKHRVASQVCHSYHFIICTTKHQEAYIQYTDQANANEVRGRDQYFSDVTLHHKN